MVAALWLVGAIAFIVYFGTWAIQIAIALLLVMARLAGWALVLIAGLVGMVWLLAFDRPSLRIALNR